MSHAEALLDLAPPAPFIRSSVAFQVRGSPAPKGSGRAILVAGHARHVPSGSDVNRKQLRSWDTNVRAAMVAAIGPRTEPVFVKTALRATVAFRMARPAGHWGKRGLKPSAPPWPYSKPDADKMARATLDSLEGAVFDDDARIVLLIASKVWAAPGDEGASITIEPMP